MHAGSLNSRQSREPSGSGWAAQRFIFLGRWGATVLQPGQLKQKAWWSLKTKPSQVNVKCVRLTPVSPFKERAMGGIRQVSSGGSSLSILKRLAVCHLGTLLSFCHARGLSWCDSSGAARYQPAVGPQLTSVPSMLTDRLPRRILDKEGQHNRLTASSRLSNKEH